MWCDDERLCSAFPALFAITSDQNAIVADVWHNGRWAPQFRRSLRVEEGTEWDNLHNKLSAHHLDLERDEVIC